MKARVVESSGVRVLFLAEARGALSQICNLVNKHGAHAVVHIGSFGFFDGESALSMAPNLLAQVANSSRVVKGEKFHQMDEQQLRESVGSQLSELSLFLAGVQQFKVPVYVVCGECEDPKVLKKFKEEVYRVPNLEIVDEHRAPVINGTKLRLLGLPGVFEESQLFNAGAGLENPNENERMWTTIWQIGELCNTVKQTFDEHEIRIFCSYSAPSLKQLLHYLAVVLRADFVMSTSIHVALSSSFCDYTAGLTHMDISIRFKRARSQLQSLWSSVKSQALEKKGGNVPKFQELMKSAVSLLTSEPSASLEYLTKQALVDMWHFNLADIHCGSLVLTASGSNVQMMAQATGFDFEKRFSAAPRSVGPRNGNQQRYTERSPEQDGESDGFIKHGKSEKFAKSNLPMGPRDRFHTTKDGSAILPSGEDAALDVAAEEKRRKKKEKRKERKDELRKSDSEQLEQHALWFKNGERPVDEILGFLDEKDRALGPKVVVKPTSRPGGAKKMVALMFFETAEQVSQAYERVNKDEAGTVSIYQPEHHRSKLFIRNKKGIPRKNN